MTFPAWKPEGSSKKGRDLPKRSRREEGSGKPESDLELGGEPLRTRLGGEGQRPKTP